MIENEFGEIPIDNGLVLESDEEIFEMANGCCLCCTARTDLMHILRTLIERSDRFDRVLIETTGLADPNPVAQTFFVDEEISRHFTLDAIVTLVDVQHVEIHLDEQGPDGVGEQAVDQIAFADRLVVNKTDLTDASHVDQVRQRLRGINATAEMLNSSYAEVRLEDVLGIGAFDLNRTMAAEPNWLDDNAHQHDPTLESVSLDLPGELDEQVLRHWLTELTTERGPDLYRIKGILAVAGAPRRVVLQGMHRMFELRPAEPWDTQRRSSRIVLIGRGLEREKLLDQLQQCQVGTSTTAHH